LNFNFIDYVVTSKIVAHSYIGQRYSEVWPTIHVPGDCCSVIKSPWLIVEAAVFELQIYLMLFQIEDTGWKWTYITWLLHNRSQQQNWPRRVHGPRVGPRVRPRVHSVNSSSTFLFCFLNVRFSQIQTTNNVIEILTIIFHRVQILIRCILWICQNSLWF